MNSEELSGRIDARETQIIMKLYFVIFSLGKDVRNP